MLEKVMHAQAFVFFSVWLLFCISQGQHGTQTTQFVAYFLIYIQGNFTVLALLNALGKRDLCLPGGVNKSISNIWIYIIGSLFFASFFWMIIYQCVSNRSYVKWGGTDFFIGEENQIHVYNWTKIEWTTINLVFLYICCIIC